MSRQEQQEIKAEYYAKAIRSIDSAKYILKNTPKDGKYYRNAKDVKVACATAYYGVQMALEGYLMTKDVPMPKTWSGRTIEFYLENVEKLDEKLVRHVNGAYRSLYVYGYVEDFNLPIIVKTGLADANTIIKKIKPRTIKIKPQN